MTGITDVTSFEWQHNARWNNIYLTSWSMSSPKAVSQDHRPRSECWEEKSGFHLLSHAEMLLLVMKNCFNNGMTYTNNTRSLYPDAPIDRNARCNIVWISDIASNGGIYNIAARSDIYIICDWRIGGGAFYDIGRSQESLKYHAEALNPWIFSKFDVTIVIIICG